MKTQIALMLLTLFPGIHSWAQPSVTLLTFESYTFADRFDTEYGRAKIMDGFQWGGGLEFGLSEVMAAELIYQRLNTDAWYEGFDRRYDGTVGMNYIMLGGTRYAPVNERVSGFGTLDLGVAWLDASPALESKSVTKFAIGARLGVRIATSERVSLRLHAQLFSPVQWFGGGFYLGTGGSGAGVSTGSTIWQFNLGGSVNFRLR